ncbi:MAG: urea carboxylase-associated family protein [Alphaproteobacteria bacterium]|nr:urea carboxylase-associated family protein [Alphaproteobacteria bacterium]
MANENLVKIPAGHGKATRLTAGQQVKLINTYGTQVVDTWALNAYELHEYMSMESSRVWNKRLNPKVGDVLVTNRRRPILTIVEDTTPGIHDTFMAACDRYRYELLGFKEYHRNCQDNMFEGLLELGVTPPFPIAASFNVFMNIPVLEDRNSVDFRPTECEPGQYITFRAEMDCYVAFSACPQDVLPIHGVGGAPPKDAHFEVLD